MSTHADLGEVRLVHEDAHCLVFDKPAGLLSVPGRGPERADCLASRALTVWPDARVVHRLDMATSGLLIMARGAEAQRALSLAFARRQTHKRYEAVVWGTPPGDEASHPPTWHVMDWPLVIDWPNRPRSKVCREHGKPSMTRWCVLGHPTPQTTRLLLEPVTGRSHQLRVHLMTLGHPILGDTLYAPPEAQSASDRLLLHATELTVPHPHDGVMATWQSTAPF